MILHDTTWYYMILHDSWYYKITGSGTQCLCRNSKNMQKQSHFKYSAAIVVRTNELMNFIYSKFTSSKWINPKAIIIPSQTRAFLFTCLLPAWVFSISLFKRKKSSLVCKCRYKGTSYDVTLLKAVKLVISIHNCVECRQPAIACLVLTCSCRCSRPDWPDLWCFFNRSGRLKLHSIQLLYSPGRPWAIFQLTGTAFCQELLAEIFRTKCRPVNWVSLGDMAHHGTFMSLCAPSMINIDSFTVSCTHILYE